MHFDFGPICDTNDIIMVVSSRIPSNLNQYNLLDEEFLRDCQGLQIEGFDV
jgi:hypothetical protein